MLATNMQKWYEAAYAQGFAQGFAHGFELGMQKGKLESKHEKGLEIARNMLAYGLDVDLITRCTGLTLEDIRSQP